MALPGSRYKPALGFILALLVTLCAAQSENSNASAKSKSSSDRVTLEAIMPPHPTEIEDEYLCTAVTLPDEPMKLYSVEPVADQSTVHHMLLFGCAKPARDDKVFPCRMSPACGGDSGENVLYGWGKNAPKIKLPDGAGFSVGPGTGIRTVVLQVHYLQIRQDDDASGVRLHLTSQPLPYSAGLIAYAAGFTIPPKKSSHLISNECCYSGFEDLHGFAFRVHTHKLGKSVYLDRTKPTEVTNSPGVKRGAERICEMDPQKPQGFYPISGNPEEEPAGHVGFTLHPGDRIKATCQFDSTSMDKPVGAGHTANDEMCNLYLMLYSELPFFSWCVDNGQWVENNPPGGMPEYSQAQEETTIWKIPHIAESVTLPSLDDSTDDGVAEGEQTPMLLGQVSGVSAGANSTLWVFHRAFRTWTGNSFDFDHKFTKDDKIRWPTILQVDRDNGTILNHFGGDEFLMPHMITPTPEGDVWVVDTGLHQVFKFSAQGKKLITAGQANQPGKSTAPVQFCQPTDVAVARDGTVYVGDGYCNSRIVVLDKYGEFLGAWKLPKSTHEGAPAPLPHSLALDECRRRLYVADRELQRVHAFDLDSGDATGYWDLSEEYGLPYAIQIGPYGAPVVLAWDRDRTDTTTIVVLSTSIGDITAAYKLPGVKAPHDFAIIPAPLALTGAGERQLAIAVGETAPHHSRLKKFILVPGEGKEGHAGAAMEFAQEESERPAGLDASHAGHGMLKPVDSKEEETAEKPKSAYPSSTSSSSDDSATEKDAEAAPLPDDNDHTAAEHHTKGNEDSIAHADYADGDEEDDGEESITYLLPDDFDSSLDGGGSEEYDDDDDGESVTYMLPDDFGQEDHWSNPSNLNVNTDQEDDSSSANGWSAFNNLKRGSSEDEYEWDFDYDDLSLFDKVMLWIAENPVTFVAGSVSMVIALNIIIPKLSAVKNQARGYRHVEEHTA